MKTSFSQIVNSLLSCFQLMSKGHRAVFKYLQWMAKTFRNVFPSLESIAKATGFSPKTVQRAVAKFVIMNWLIKVRRPYQSNVYYMPDEIIDLNIDDSSAFFRNVHQCDQQEDQQHGQQNVQVLSTHSSPLENHVNKESRERLLMRNLDQNTTPLMSLPGLTFGSICELMLAYDDRTLAQAVKNTHWYMSQPGNYIKSMKKWIEKTAQNLRNNRW
jgi:helix-turn-helix protein